MKIDQVSNGFCIKIRETGVEDAASERVLMQNTSKDIDSHGLIVASL
jgi:hypothetical protein